MSYPVNQMCLGSRLWSWGEENGPGFKQLKSGNVGCLVCQPLHGLGRLIYRYHLGRPQSLIEKRWWVVACIQ